MLVLSRKDNESLIIGEYLRVTIVKISGNRVRIGIDAPPNVKVIREEIADRLIETKAGDPPSEIPSM